jgi:hypothetical protein
VNYRFVAAVALSICLNASHSVAEYQLPIYTYSIRSGDYTETDILRQSFDRVIPGNRLALLGVRHHERPRGALSHAG